MSSKLLQLELTEKEAEGLEKLGIKGFKKGKNEISGKETTLILDKLEKFKIDMSNIETIVTVSAKLTTLLYK